MRKQHYILLIEKFEIKYDRFECVCHKQSRFLVKTESHDRYDAVVVVFFFLKNGTSRMVNDDTKTFDPPKRKFTKIHKNQHKSEVFNVSIFPCIKNSIERMTTLQCCP